MNWSAIVINAVEISALIFLLMVFVEIVELRYSGWLRRHFVESRSLKYVLSSLIGSIPGCTGSFLMDTLYMAGIAGFGSLVSTMITSMGDEAFYLISLAAQQGNLVSTQFLFAFFALLFFIGVIGGAGFYAKNKGVEDEVSVSEENILVDIKSLSELVKGVTIEKVATIKPAIGAPLIARTGGRVTGINFNLGDTVRAGQLIISIDTGVEANPARVQLNALQSSLAQLDNIAREALKAAD
ncbi:hypothetical protein IIB79_02815, partial [candidate division KSB1 bacterium]|nr:hypothetical protein [candidate division KSB1 bacterium]